MTLAIRLFLHHWSKWRAVQGERASVRLRIQPKMMKECAGVMQTLYYVTSSLTANTDREENYPAVANRSLGIAQMSVALARGSVGVHLRVSQLFSVHDKNISRQI